MSQDGSSVGAATAVSVGAAAVQLVDGTSKRENLIVHNNHATQVLYVGSTSAVVVADGLPIPAGQSKEFRNYIGPLFAIASGAATDTRVWEVGPQ